MTNLTSFDPYNSPIRRVDSDNGDARIQLFPLSYSANSKSGNVPREIRLSAKQPMANLPIKPVQPAQACSDNEIMELRRRLEQIKQRRSEQRNRTLELQRENEPLEEMIPTTEPRRQPPVHQTNPPKTNKEALQPTAPIVPSRRRPSMSNETTSETIDTSLNSLRVSKLNPRRLFCSKDKIKPNQPLTRVMPEEQVHPFRNANRAVMPQETEGISDLDGVATTNLLESLVCLRPNAEDPLDLMICGGGSGGRLLEDNYGKNRENAAIKPFDPYESRGVFDADGGSLNFEVISSRGRAYSVVRERDDGSTLPTLSDSKSCIPRRNPTWYERPDTIETKRSDLEMRTMELVFYSKDPNESFDKQMKFSSLRSFD